MLTGEAGRGKEGKPQGLHRKSREPIPHFKAVRCKAAPGKIKPCVCGQILRAYHVGEDKASGGTPGHQLPSQPELKAPSVLVHPRLAQRNTRPIRAYAVVFDG